MKIAEKVYNSLSPRQRVKAGFEAMSRKDYKEVKRLADTSTCKTAVVLDVDYFDTMQALLHLILAAENDMRGLAIWYCLELHSSTGETLSEQALCLAKKIVSIDAAIEILLDDYGVSKETLLAAVDCRHPVVDSIIRHGIATADDKMVDTCLAMMDKALQK